ncbi:MAG: hypothetical protein AAFW66_06330 [Pseudomonadota bacterium]
MTASNKETWDFFISRAGPEREFAKWIAILIEIQGGKVLLQDKDFGHQDFMGACIPVLPTALHLWSCFHLLVSSQLCLANC